MSAERTGAGGGIVAGMAAIAGLYTSVSPAQAQTALDKAWSLGLRSFDTAPHYGSGESERRIGSFLQTRPREEFRLQTKVGRLLRPDPSVRTDDASIFAGLGQGIRQDFDFSADGVRRSHAESLDRLGLERVDTLLVHDPESHLDAALTDAAGALGRLRADGVIRGWGVGTNIVPVAEAFLEQTDLDRILIAGRYSLLDRRAEAMLDRAADAGVDVLVAGVLNGGLLLGGRAGLPMFNYVAASEPLRTAAAAMEQVCREHRVELRAAAFQFPRRHRGVTRTVIGSGTAEEFTDTLVQLSVQIPDELWAALDRCVPDQSLLPD